MASRKTPTFTLNLDFNVEKTKLQEISSLLDKNLSKSLTSGKGESYLNNITAAFTQSNRQAQQLYKTLSKPMVSKTEATKLGNTLENIFDNLDDKLLSFQGNVAKTFNSIGNAESLKKIRTLGNEINKMLEDYQKINQLNSQIKGLGNKSEINKQINKANKDLAPLKAKQKEGALSKAEIKRQTELLQIIDEGNKKLQEKLVLQEKINNTLQSYGASSAGDLKGKIDDKILEQNNLTDASMSMQDFNTLKQVLSDLRLLLIGLQNASKNSTLEIARDMDEQKAAFDRAEDQARTFKAVLNSIGISFSLDFVVQGLKRVGRYSYEYIKNLDRALTEISVVSNKTREEAMALTDTFIDLSARTGMAIDDIAQASTIFYQQGLNDKAVEQMTEWTALFAKISNETVPEAADQLTAAINGFGFAAEDVGNVVDKMSVLAAYSAADINELATAMSKGASAAAQAGLSFDQYNAYLATMIETTREAPENIGTSLKTIMARFQQVKTEGSSEDGETDVNAVETALKSVGIQLRDSQNQLRDLGDVLDELGPRWNTLDRNTQAYLGTVIAGTRQQSRFISLMQNWDRALELVEASENSAGAATRMHAKAMDGLDASLNKLTNAWQNLISTLANGDTFKWFIDIGTEFLKWLAEGNSLIKVLGLSIGLLNLGSFVKNLNALRQKKNYENINTSLTALKQTTASYRQTLKALTQAQSEETLAIKSQATELHNLANAYDHAKMAKQGYNATPVTGGVPGSVAGATNVQIVGTIPNKGMSLQRSGLGGTGQITKPTFWNKLGKGASTFTSNLTAMLGTFQTALTVFSLVTLAIEGITDLMYTSADEIREKAQERYDETQKNISKQLDLIEAVETNSRVYDELSTKLNKSADEVQKLADATDALAEAAPGAVIGYDSDGNAIISTSKARAAASLAEKELAEAAKQQIGNLGSLGLADLREAAEKSVKDNTIYDEAKTGGKWATGISAGLATAATAATLMPEPVISKGVAVILWGLTAISGLFTMGASAAEKAAISQEQLNMAQEKAGEIQEKYRGELLQYMSYITDAKLSSRTIQGTSENQRSEMAAFVNSVWLGNKEQELLQKLANEEITAKEYEAAYKNLGEDWTKVLDGIGENALASGYKGLEEVIENIGYKTYDSVEQAIEKVIQNDMGISSSDPLFATIKEGFLAAAYNGVGGGIDQIVKDLEKRKSEDTGNTDAYDKAIQSVKGYTANQASFMDQVGLLDNVDVFNAVMGSSGDSIKNALAYSQSNATLGTIDALETYKAQQEQILKDTHNIVDWTTVDMETLTEEQKKLVKNIQDSSAAIETAWGSLPYSSSKTWASLFEDYEKITERTKTAYETLHKLTSGDGLSYDEFKTFATTLDSINLEAFDSGQVNQYARAIDRVTESLYVENGALYMNAAAVEDIASLEQMLAEAEKQQIKNTLISRRAELETAYAVIQAEIAHLKYKIAAAEGSAEAEQLKIDANNAWLTASNKANDIFNRNNAKLTEAIVGQFSSAFLNIGTKYNQLMTGLTNGEVTQSQLNALKEEWQATIKELNFESYDDKLDNSNIIQLKSQLQAAEKAAESYQFQISNINFQLAVLDSGFRDTAEGTGQASKALDEYVSKLERFLELLKHIEREQQNLSVAEMFEDSKTGSAVITALDRQLKYTQHLIQDTKELYLGYEEEASKQAAIIMKGYGDMIKFDKWGNYDLDFSKYDKLSDKEKEKLDDWLSTYDDLVEKRDDYYNQHLEYIVAELENNQKRIDKYIDAEDELVEAIKQREQKILDNKLAAIDKEIDAIEKAAEARRKAREEENNAQELSSMQVDLQRALMDSSGASATQILDIQKQIKEKQQEMADDSFDTMVDDMKTQLEEEKEMEKALFDERLEEMDWYWDEVDRIMSEGTDSVLETMQMYLDDYNQSSELQQTELLKGWTDTFEQALTIGKAGAKELQTVVSNLQSGINDLVIDEDVLTDEAINTKFESRPKVEQPKTSTSGGNGSTNKYTYNKNDNNKDLDDDTYTIRFSDANGNTWTENVKKGSSIKLYDSKAMPRDGYEFLGWSYNGQSISGSAGGSYTPTGDMDIVASWKAKDTGPKDTTPKSAFNVGDRVKTKESGPLAAAKSYTWTGSSFKQNGTKYVNLWGPAIDYFSIGDKKYWDGKWWYQINNTKDWYPGSGLRYKRGGMVYSTGPAWLDGTSSHPEAVLNAMQTKAFLSFTDDLAALRAEGGVSTNSSVVIDNISFNVESMSSVADGEKAFNTFVDKFKEIGAKQGISILGTANRN